MKARSSLFVLLGLCLAFAAVVNCETDFEDDGGAVVEDENEPAVAALPEEDEERVKYQPPKADATKYHFAEHFDDMHAFEKSWIKSKAKKEDIADEIAKYDGIWANEQPKRSILENDFGLVLKSKAQHAAISSLLTRPYIFTGNPFVVQYEVTLQEGQDCGGAYIKLLSTSKDKLDLTNFQDKTPYTIMFGPDKCGNDVKLHFIFRHVNPITGNIEEKHAKKPKDRLEETFKDKQPHLYKLVINPDSTFRISVDHKVINEGHMLKDFTPAVNPEKEIDDPKDFKPETWDEREKIPDPTAVKPDDWDVPPQIQDPSAIKPENWIDDEEEMIPDSTAEIPKDWDTEIDGSWEAPLIKNPLCEENGCGKWEPPMIANPEYKGKWRAPLLDNPNYQGKWAPRRIQNPEYFEDNNPFSRLTPIAAVGIELWSMSTDILFDNIVITDDETYADEWAMQTYDLKRKHLDKQAETFVQKMTKIVNDSPWVVAIVVVVVGLPISIILYMLCSTSPKKGDSKKTDDYTADDVAADEAAVAALQAARPKSKLDLNEPEMKPEEEAIEEENVEDQEQDAQPEPEVSKPSETTSRKRKPRKE